MRNTVSMLASMALAVLLAGGGIFASFGDLEASAQTQQKPNFVFIITDDMRYDDLEYMPKTRALLGSRGMRFENAFVSLAMCCPSRATIMRGQYAHNTGVWSNEDTPSTAGWAAYKRNGNETDNVATRLRGAGYRTGLFGKYLNGYTVASPVPQGWSDWFATESTKYFDYNVNDNGTVRRYGREPGDYVTDVLREQTKQFIDSSVGDSKPFFAYVAPLAPHSSRGGVATPAPRDRREYDGLRGPRPPSFNERDISDKPRWISTLPLLTTDDVAQINWRQQNRAESLQSVDDLVSQVVNKLDSANVLDNTYIVFTSDNGWQVGEHRIASGKRRPYEESIRMPLLVRGPRVAAGSISRQMVLNTDYLPTFTDLAGIQTPGYVDGRSLRPLLTRSATTWRTAILLETRYPNNFMSSHGIRKSDGLKYIAYGDGFRELYDLKTDPYEMKSRFDPDRPPTDLMARLGKLKDCAGAECRAAEDGE